MELGVFSFANVSKETLIYLLLWRRENASKLWSTHTHNHHYGNSSWRGEICFSDSYANKQIYMHRSGIRLCT